MNEQAKTPEKLYLHVHIGDKDEAKGLGARWDKDAKLWYVPEGIDPAPFERWMPSDEQPAPNVKSDYFFLMIGVQKCWKCSDLTPVYSLAVPRDHQEPAEDLDDVYEKEDGYEEDPETVWEDQGCNGVLSHADWIEELAAIIVVKATGDRYKPAYNATLGGNYYMNHCKCCGEKQGDHFVHSKPGGAFFPDNTHHHSVVKIDLPLLASANIAYGDDVIDFELNEYQPKTIKQWISDKLVDAKCVIKFKLKKLMARN